MKLLLEKSKKIVAVITVLIAPLFALAQDGTQEVSKNWFMSEPVFWILIAVALILLYLIYALGQLLILGTKWRIKDKGGSGLMLLVFAAFTLISGNTYAQDAVASAPKASIFSDPYFPLYALIVIELIIVSYLLYSLKVSDQARSKYGRKLGVFSMMWRGFNPAASIEREDDILLGDHVYDGIRELDNVMPTWLRFLFIATIVVAVIYIPYYFFGGPSQREKNNESIAKAEAAKEDSLKNSANLVDENTVVLTLTPDILSAGKEVFATYCVACHGNEGEGGVGPNFVDDYWIHGGSIKNVFATIKYGVPEMGMAAWEEILTPPQISEVANYIKSMHGTNPPNQKEHQGVIWKEESASTDSTATSTDTSAVVLLQK